MTTPTNTQQQRFADTRTDLFVVMNRGYNTRRIHTFKQVKKAFKAYQKGYYQEYTEILTNLTSFLKKEKNNSNGLEAPGDMVREIAREKNIPLTDKYLDELLEICDEPSQVEMDIIIFDNSEEL